MRELATQKTMGGKPIMPCFDLNFCAPDPWRLLCHDLNANRFCEGNACGFWQQRGNPSVDGDHWTLNRPGEKVYSNLRH